MAYHRKSRQHRRLARVSARQTFAAQGEDLAKKALVDGGVALFTGIGANYFCTRRNPDYVLCIASSDFANKQAEKFRDSLAGLGAWGFMALLAAIL